MIEVRKLRKAYGGGALAQTVLHDVDLSVRSGEVLMLVGPSGSGKTTLLSILGCVLTPSGGSVQLAGHELMGVPEASLPMMRLRYIGFIFQSHNLLPSLSALDNVRLPLLLRGWSSGRATAESTELLESVGLRDKLVCLPSQLSGGQAQRVAIARALAGRPPIILADEPTAALDAHTGQGVMETLTRLAHEGGHTVVVVTHDNRIFKFGDRIVRIEDGRITEDTAHANA
ncbi:MAG: ABC transporter ATP-binding protein [Archangiaceae bacterium]|nr:ABC transporter ATP-binding protein [Archangiaceae bacterium]